MAAATEASGVTVFRGADFATLEREPDLRDPETGGDQYLAWRVGQTPQGATLCVQMKAGRACGVHAHPDMTHYVNVVRGRVVLKLERGDIELQPGDCYVVPAGVPHDVAAGPEADPWFVETTLREATGA